MMGAYIRKRLSNYLGAPSPRPDPQEGLPQLPPLFVIRNTLPSRIEAHRHDFFEIELILEGRGWNRVGVFQEAFDAGSVFLGNQFEDHEIECTTAVTVLSVKFAADFLPRPGALLDPLVAPDAAFRCRLPPLAPPAARHFREAAETLLAEYTSQPPLWVEACRAALMDLLVLIGRTWDARCRAAGLSGASRASPLVLGVLSYVDAHFCEPQGLMGLEAHLGYSRSHLNRVFRTVAGQSIQEFVIARRMRHACQLLSGTDLTVTDIALASGFNDLSHFTRSFRLAQGQSPRLYRQKHLSGQPNGDR